MVLIACQSVSKSVKVCVLVGRVGYMYHRKSVSPSIPPSLCLSLSLCGGPRVKTREPQTREWKNRERANKVTTYGDGMKRRKEGPEAYCIGCDALV